MNPLWVSLSAYGGVTTRAALHTFWAAGIRHVELAIGVKPTPDTVAVLQAYQQQGMQYRAHHALVWAESRSFNLAATFDAGYFERLTDWLATMDITAYSVHAGSYPAGADRPLAYAQWLQHLAQLAQLCRDRHINLGVETMYPSATETHQYLLQNQAEIMQFRQDQPDLHLVVDLSHLNLWRDSTIAEKLSLFQLAERRLLEIHISDNNGDRDRHMAITSNTWWLPYRHLWPRDTPIVLESRMNHQSVEQIRQHYQTIQQLL